MSIARKNYWSFDKSQLAVVVSMKLDTICGASLCRQVIGLLTSSLDS
jgi:hypothetical protein